MTKKYNLQTYISLKNPLEDQSIDAVIMAYTYSEVREIVQSVKKKGVIYLLG